MNWWDILKQTYNPQDLFGVQGQTTTRKPMDKTPQYDPTRTPQINPEEQPATESAIQQNTLDMNPEKWQQSPLNARWATPQEQNFQTQTTQYTGAGSGAEDSGTDDTDVGTIRENVNRAKQNFTQLPRGPKALPITRIITDLSAAAIDPVNQKNIVLGAKKKLQDAFPQVA